MSLKGKRIWLTGASSGIGEALALELGARGAECILTARREEVLGRICDRINSAGGKAYSFVGDVRDLQAMKKIAQTIETQHGPLDILIANAGTHVFSKPEHFDSAEYLDLMEINFGGMVKCIEAVLPKMIERGSGRIVGMASMAGFRGLPRAAAYGASKTAMGHFLESIRFHLERKKVAVTIVNPGFVRTPLTDKNDFHMPFLVEAPRAAKIIADGIARGKKEISFPWPFSWVMKLMRIVPYALYEKIIKLLWKD